MTAVYTSSDVPPAAANEDNVHVFLSGEEASDVRECVRRIGDKAVAKRCRVSPTTVARGLAGLPIRYSSKLALVCGIQSLR